MHDLAPMLEARSVAVVGASARHGSFGEQMLIELERGGYAGSIYPVNPRYQEVRGLKCLPAVSEIETQVDLVLLGVSNALVEEQLTAAAAAGAKAAVIYSSCYEAPIPGSATLIDRLTSIARDSGMLICGGNCMGFLNLTNGLRACGFPMPEGLRPGGVSFISHSGSAFAAMAHNDRDLRFNLVISAGQEFTTTVADYLDYVLDLESTCVAALFLEAVRDPGTFRAALNKATEADIPIVALKVGREEQARSLVAAHSGALAGDDAAFEALFDAYGVLRVKTLDEMADTVELLASGRRAGPGALASIHDSGGERALIVDSAADAGVEWAKISRRTKDQLAETLEGGLDPINPLDAWGTGNEAEEIYENSIETLMADNDTAALAFCVDLTTEDDSTASYASTAIDVFKKSTKPFAMLSNMASAIDHEDAARIRSAGIPILEGTATGLAAFKHLFELRDHRARPRAEVPAPHLERQARWRKRLAAGDLDETDALQLVAEYGVPVVDARVAADADGALTAAHELGWPVALKTAMPSISHKTEAGGVVLGIEDVAALTRAYDDLAIRLGPRVTVESMAPAGVELALGMVHDAQFGPLVMVGAGGIWIEVFKDRRWALPPLDESRARTLIDSLAIRPLLDGLRGRDPVDIESVAHAVVAMSQLALELGDQIDGSDVNPLIASPNGCIAVDALVIPRP
jgi:acetate---CoA ligase (ADP-forming)